jgi:hypothetical protein
MVPEGGATESMNGMAGVAIKTEETITARDVNISK